MENHKFKSWCYERFGISRQNTPSDAMSPASSSPRRILVQVLEALRALHRRDGADGFPLEDIVSYIDINYPENEDVHPRVITALRRAVDYGMVGHRRGLYHYIGVLARDLQRHRNCSCKLHKRKSGKDARFSERNRSRGSEDTNCSCASCKSTSQASGRSRSPLNPEGCVIGDVPKHCRNISCCPGPGNRGERFNISECPSEVEMKCDCIICKKKVSTSGPIRKQNEPDVIFVCGCEPDDVASTCDNSPRESQNVEQNEHSVGDGCKCLEKLRLFQQKQRSCAQENSCKSHSKQSQDSEKESFHSAQSSSPKSRNVPTENCCRSRGESQPREAYNPCSSSTKRSECSCHNSLGKGNPCEVMTAQQPPCQSRQQSSQSVRRKSSVDVPECQPTSSENYFCCGLDSSSSLEQPVEHLEEVLFKDFIEQSKTVSQSSRQSCATVPRSEKCPTCKRRKISRTMHFKELETYLFQCHKSNYRSCCKKRARKSKSAKRRRRCRRKTKSRRRPTRGRIRRRNRGSGCRTCSSSSASSCRTCRRF